MVSDGIGNFKKGKVKNLFLTLTPNITGPYNGGFPLPPFTGGGDETPIYLIKLILGLLYSRDFKFLIQQALCSCVCVWLGPFGPTVWSPQPSTPCSAFRGVSPSNNFTKIKI